MVERELEPGQEDAWRAAWSALAEAVGQAGGNAWAFRQPDTGRRLEFIEYRAGSDPATSPAAREGAAALDRLAPAVRDEEWEEA